LTKEVRVNLSDQRDVPLLSQEAFEQTQGGAIREFCGCDYHLLDPPGSLRSFFVFGNVF